MVQGAGCEVQGVWCMQQRQAADKAALPSSSSVLLSGLELSDTQGYEP